MLMRRYKQDCGVFFFSFFHIATVLALFEAIVFSSTYPYQCDGCLKWRLMAMLQGFAIHGG